MNRCVVVSLALAVVTCASAKNFVADLDGVRNAAATTVAGKPALFVSSVDGDIACYTLDGREVWKTLATDRALLFEIEAADLDGDGRDELLGASANGHVYCWNQDGSERWAFDPGHKVRFSEIAVVNVEGGKRVFAAGNDFNLYEIDADGHGLSATPIKGTVRALEAGDFMDSGRPSLFLMTYAHDKFRWQFMGFIDPVTKRVEASLPYGPKHAKFWERLMITDMDVADVDGDQRDDVLFFGTGGDASHSAARCFAFNGEFARVAEFAGPGKDRQRYAHAKGASLQPVRDEIVVQYGGVGYVLDLKGKLKRRFGEPHRGIIFSDFVLEPQSRQLIAAGEVDGGNGIYQYPLDRADWWKREHKLQGRMVEVAQNLDTLWRQTLAFEPPEYQKRTDKPWVMITSIPELPEVRRLNAADIRFAKQYTWHEDFDRSALVAEIGKDALKRDRRGKYVVKREEILAIARDHEARGEPFAAWAGHGNDPFYLSLETMKAILEAAPTMCYGFVFAEMENPVDPRYIYFVDKHIPRLVEACRRQGVAKLYFRYKNVFWAASSHQDPWRRMFFSRKYSDVLVPSAEDTNSRTQDINFTGRVGMLTAGYVNDYAMRLVDDNPTSWRPLSPGGQRSVSPYLRNGALLAAYGSRYGILFNIGYLEKPGMNILFALMKSGAIPVVEAEDILSIGSWHLIKDLDTEWLHGIDDGHSLLNYSPEDGDGVFSYAKVCWCGTSLPEYDYSRAALGVEYRWLNFMPPMPHGMVPVAPYEFSSELKKSGTPYFVSNTRRGYVNGKWVPAAEFGSAISATVEAGQRGLPLVVSGASWGLIRLDEKHVRLLLVDPGYIDPRKRTATIRFQSLRPAWVKDILSGEAIDVSANSAEVTVPAGSLRLIDIATE